MKRMVLAAALFGLGLPGCVALEQPEASVTAPVLDAAMLVGTWDVEMYYSVTESPSSTELVITEARDGKLTGSFYQSDFEAANYSIRRGILAFGATTSDGSATYSHSGRLAGEPGQQVIEGQTLSSGRNFLMIWSAKKRG